MMRLASSGVKSSRLGLSWLSDMTVAGPSGGRQDKKTTGDGCDLSQC